jgi:phage tail-like protein
MRFLVTIGDVEIGRFSECSGIEVEYETLDWPEGGENGFVHKLRGRAKYKNLVLKRGLTNEKGLMDWFRACSDRTQRKAITVELRAGDATAVRKFSFDGAFPVKWTGPNLAAGQNQAAVETLEIAHHGFAEL